MNKMPSKWSFSMLDDPRRQAVAANADWLAVLVHAFDNHFFGPCNVALQAGDGEAAFDPNLLAFAA